MPEKEIERRFMPLTAEMRIHEDDESDVGRLTGRAAVTNQLSEDLGGFRERIAPGAFDGVVEKSDIRALFNHEPSAILGRMKSGTLKVEARAEGLDYEVELPNTDVGETVFEGVKRGDIDGNSFSFTVPEDGSGEEWKTEDGALTRTITRFEELFDVGPVTYPAYPQTKVSARCLERAQECRAAETAPVRRELARRRQELLESELQG